MTAASKTYQLGDDLGALCEFLASAPNGMTEAELSRHLRDEWTLDEVHRGLQSLVNAAIVTDGTPGVENSTLKAPRFEYRPPLSFQWNLLNPARACRALRSFSRLLMGGIGVAISILGLGIQLAVVGQVPLANATALDFLVACVVLLVGVAAHELSHGIVLTAEGGEPRRMGFMLFYLTPAFFCDVSDGWRLGSRSRVRVALAGVLSQCQFGAIVAVMSLINGAFKMSLTLFVAFNLISVVANLMPLLKLDGYLALTAAVKIPNLRMRAIQAWWSYIGRLGRRAGGTESRATSGSELPGWAIPFGALSAITPPTVFALTTSLLVSTFFPGRFELQVGVFVAVLGAWALVRATQLAATRLGDRTIGAQ